MDDDEIDGCEFSDADETTPDEDIDGIVLFASVAGGGLADIENHRRKWEVLFGGS